MDLSQWLVAELDDTTARLRGQVLDLVPRERQLERMPGGNSISWAVFHVARHAALALRVAGFLEPGPDERLASFDPRAVAGGAGLQEVEQPWAAEFDPVAVDGFASSVLGDVRRYLGGLSPAALDERPDVESGLEACGIEPEEFGWLYGMWGGQPLGFLVRWPLIGHVTNHVGEMISTRNQLGLSPFR